jgi:hypothetical protein
MLHLRGVRARSKKCLQPGWPVAAGRTGGAGLLTRCALFVVTTAVPSTSQRVWVSLRLGFTRERWIRTSMG